MGAMAEASLLVQREVAIAAKPERVWSFLVDPEQAVRWMGQAASFDLRPGGEYRVHVLPHNVAVGTFVEIDPPRRLVYTWGWEPGSVSTLPPGSTIVEFDLIPLDDGTLVRLTHRNLPTTSAAESHAQGWQHYLDRLVVVTVGGDPDVDPWLTRPRS